MSKKRKLEQAEEDDGNKKQKLQLYCTCQQPYDQTKCMIACDECDNWFHLECLQLTPEQAQEIATYTCPNCAKISSSQPIYFSQQSDEDDAGSEDLALESENEQNDTDENVTSKSTVVEREHTVVIKQKVRVKIVEVANSYDDESNTKPFSKEEMKKLCADLNYLSMLAQKENATFQPLSSDTRHKLLIDYETHNPIGYFTYTLPQNLLLRQKKKKQSLQDIFCLRQIYIVPSQRTKGFASMLLHYFLFEMVTEQDVTEYCNNEMWIESPNEKTCAALYKMRLAKKLPLALEVTKKRTNLRRQVLEHLKEHGKESVCQLLQTKKFMLFVQRNKKKEEEPRTHVLVYIPKNNLNFDIA